jgi:YYY domain-containing protein
LPIDDNVKREPFWSRHRVTLMLLAILAIAAFFRFYGRDFDAGTLQHPDERFIVMRATNVRWPATTADLLNKATSPLNLRSTAVDPNCPPGGCEYPYGSLPVYLTRLAGWVLDLGVPEGDPQKGYTLFNLQGVATVGRHMSSIFDLLTVLLVFLIARRLYSSSAALIASALVAFSVTHIQLSHFGASDTFLTTFMMAALYFSVIMMQRPSWWAAVGAGTFLGLAVASKVTILFYGLVIVAAVVLRAAYRKQTRQLGAEFGDPIGVKPASAHERARSFGSHLLGGMPYLILAGLFSFLAFAVTEPYVLWQFDYSILTGGGADVITRFLDSNSWSRRILAEANTQSGRGDVPYTRQYVGTVPLLYHLQQMVYWGLSPLPGFLTVIGFAAGLWRAVRRRPAEVLLMAGAIPYFYSILTLEAKWMRYMLPLVPVFCILGAAFLVRGTIWARKRYAQRPRGKRAPALTLQRALFPALTALAVGGAFLWAVAFMNIYTQPHSRIQASAWAFSNIPEGVTIAKDTTWDDQVPFDLPPSNGQERSIGSKRWNMGNNTELYDYLPPEQELMRILDWLRTVDYISVPSNRVYGSVTHMPWAYPVQIKYYELLYGEKLGFIKVHTSQVMPQLFGMNFNDQAADESFTVYDHPRVDYFKKVSNLNEDQLRTLFSTALNRPPGEFSAQRHDNVSDDRSLLYGDVISDQPVTATPDLGDFAWNPLAQEETQWIGVLLWLIVAYVLGLVALPIVFTLGRNLPDRAYPAAKAVGLLLVSWGTWMLASARLLPFTFWSILLVVLMVAGLSLVCWRLGAGAQIKTFFREKRALVIFYEALFLLAFGAFIWLRVQDPDLWQPFNGGEKPMEFGILNSVLRSPWMPPLDPFFSGGYLNYYYQGHFIVACMVKLTGMDPAVAFNVAIPFLYALTFTGAATIVYNLVAWSRRRRGSTHAVSRAGLAFAVLGSVMMLVSGNMHALFQFMVIQFPLLGKMAISMVRGLGVRPVAEMYTNYDFWGPSRIISPDNTINEFPYWSFLFADLHPHLIDMPFTLLATLLALNLAFAGPFRRLARRATRRHVDEAQSVWERVQAALEWLWGRGWAGVLTFGVTAITLGTLVAVNSWDYPTFLAVVGGAILIAVLLAGRLGSAEEENEGGRVETSNRLAASGRLILVGTSISSAGILAVVALLAYLPYFLNFKAFYTQIMPLVDGQPLGGNPGAYVMSRTDLWEFLFIWALFVFITLSYLVMRLWQFPWRYALSSLARIVPSRSASIPATPLPQHAFAPMPAPAPQRAGGLALAAASATPTGGGASLFNMAFQTDAEGLSAVRDTTIRDDDAAVASEIPDGNGSDPASMERRDWVVANAEQPGDGSGDGIGAELAEKITPGGDGAEDWLYYGDGDGREDGTLYATSPNNWVSEAHTQVQVAIAQPARIEQPGVVPLWAGLGMLAVTAALVLSQLATGQFLFALLIALIGGILATSLSTTRSASALIIALLLVGACAVAMGVELVYLVDHLGGDYYRMNTVFKFYVHVWMLFAAGGAGAVYYILYGLRDRAARGAKANELESAAAHGSQLDGHLQATETLTASNDTPFRLEQIASPAEEVASPSIISTHATHVEDENWLVWASTGPLNEPGEVAGEDAAQPLIPALPNGVSSQSAPVAVIAETRVEKPVSSLEPNWTVTRIAWAGVFALVLLASLLYALLITPARLNDRFAVRPPIGTLNGMKYMTVATFGTDVSPQPIQAKYDYEAIRWMNENLSGAHVIAEAPYGYYREFGMRAASNTGFQIVIGGLHQDEQRAGIYARLVFDRQRDMDEFFRTTDVQRALTIMSKYDIDVIYLGQLERARSYSEGQDRAGTPQGVIKFAQMADPKVGILTEVFKAQDSASSAGTTIYMVSKSREKDPKVVVGSPVEGSGIPGISITPMPTPTATPQPTPPVDDPELKALIDATVADPLNRDTRMRLVDWYRNHQFFLDAARELRTIISQDPQSVSLRHILGDALQAAGRPDEALKAWEEARDVNPNDPAAHNKVGIAYAERRRYDDAIREFQEVVRLSPIFNEAWFHMGEAYEAKGEIDNAKRAYQSAIDKADGPNGWVDAARDRLAKLK